MFALLLTAIFLPLAGAAGMWIVAPLGRSTVRWTALAVAVATLALAATIIERFVNGGAILIGNPSEPIPWLQVQMGVPIDIQFDIGLDGLSLWLFGLSALLMVTAVLVSWDAIDDRPALFYSMLLLLEFGCLGVFAARDVILFYVFFEFTLIPLFFLIGIWGSEQRQYAARKFFLFTLAGSLLTFLGLLAIVFSNYRGTGELTFSIPALIAALSEQPLPLPLQGVIFLALFAGFAVKVPLFPLHTWLPLAHVEAPTAGSVILAGILLKIGTYGFLRFSIPMLPGASAAFMPAVLWLGVIGIIYGALVALAQSDIKRLIAYSSVSHLGFCMVGLFALNAPAVSGATLQMINHGISTGALFALVGMLYERYHTREIKAFGGLAGRLPWMAFFMLVFTFSSIGLPGLNGFAGELLILLGMFQRAWSESASAYGMHLKLISILAVAGVVLGAWYMLWMVGRVFFGPLRQPDHGGDTVRDLSMREILALAPLAVFVVWIGVQPGFFLTPMSSALQPLTESARRCAMEQAETGAVLPAVVGGPLVHRDTPQEP